MSANRDLANLFQQMSRMLELLAANRFKVVAYERAARALKALDDDVAQLAADPAELTDIDGIGKGMADRIVEYVRDGKIAEYDELRQKIPAGVLQIMQVPGIGPKTAATLWKQGGIESIEQLREKLDSGDLTKLPRLGVKTLEAMRKSLDFAEAAGQRVRLGEALPVAVHVVRTLKAIKGIERIDYAGSVRRGEETIGDVDILVACRNRDAVADAFVKMDLVDDVLQRGTTKCSIRSRDGLQVDLRMISADQYGAALAYFTGSKQHNVRLRERAVRQQMRLNEYGLWRAEDADDREQTRPVAGETEQAIYEALGLKYIPPELREDRGEIEAAERDALPDLIEISDIQAELHAHTTASDGSLSIEELATLAAERGMHTVAVTDHSAAQVQARGLDAKRLEKHVERVREANKRAKGIRILAGTEVDILADGKLDYPNSILRELDIVVASPHSGLNQDRAKCTKRLLRAIENPYVHIIGHPTGRLLGRREGLSPDIKQLAAAAAETGTALELNANPARLDLRDTHLRIAVDAGASIAINTDAHGVADLELLRFGVITARRGWVKTSDVINCLSAQKLLNWLKQKRQRMGL